VSEGRRDIYWNPWEEPGSEHLRLSIGADGAHADGLILRRKDGLDLRAHYSIETDSDWCVRRLHFALLGTEKGLHLESDGHGTWTVNREPAPVLTGCLDLDIEVTPFTNTLPLRRLGLEAQESAEIRVAYIPVPDLEVRPVEQRYTCLAPLGPGGGRYRYEGPFRDFTAEIEVDADGLVLDYPETFRRIWPR
jgi:hypothetical protein